MKTLLTRINVLEAAAHVTGAKTYLIHDALDPDVFYNVSTGEDLTGAQAKQLQSTADVTVIKIVYEDIPLP